MMSTRCLLLVAFLFVAVACSNSSTEPAFALKQLGTNVWAAIDNPKAQPSAGSNAGFVVGDDGVAVIDTFSTADAAKQLLREIHRVTKLPIRFAIDTHYHLDHVGGNGVFAAAGATVVAQRNVRDWIRSDNLRMITDGMAAEHLTITPEQRTAIEALMPPAVTYDDSLDLYLGSRRLHL